MTVTGTRVPLAQSWPPQMEGVELRCLVQFMMSSVAAHAGCDGANIPE
jgi:hypothetical protein